MGDRWLHASLSMIAQAVRSGDPERRRQAAAICRILLELLDDGGAEMVPPPPAFRAPPAYPPMMFVPMPTMPRAAPPPAFDWAKLLPFAIPALQACIAGDWSGLLELVKPFVGAELKASGQGFKMPFPFAVQGGAAEPRES